SFQVSFNYWQLVLPPEPEPSNGKKHKKTGPLRSSRTKTPIPKYENYNPKVVNTLVISNPNIPFVGFRVNLFQSCDKNRPWVSESLRNAWYSDDHNIDIQGFIHASRGRKATKMAIEDEDSFRVFMALARSVPSQTVMGFKIFHENPKLTANANRNLEIARQKAASKDPLCDSDKDPESEGSAGSAILTLGERYNRTLWAQFSKGFRAGENIGRFVNPKDPGEVMILNTARIRTWANDWAEGVPGVDEVNPPMKRSEFRWFPVADYEKEKNLLLNLSGGPQPASSSGTIVHHNYYGQPFPAAGLPNPLFNQPCPAPPNFQPPTPMGTTVSNAPTECLRLSPPPTIPDFENFLVFAGIGPEMKKTRDILSDEGIDLFARLLDRKTYSFKNFRSMGIPFAHAEDLSKSVPKYNHYLKSL
ncbi:hypothetical protein DFH28DRAFT_1167695, partial [Melampsora americana]